MVNFHSFALLKNRPMSKQNLVILLTIIVGISTRFMEMLPPNFGAIGAIALFGGAYFSNRALGLVLPLSVLLASDLIIGLTGTGTALYTAQPFVYGGFLLIGLLGFLLRKGKSPLKIAGGSLGGSVIFYLVSNFGVWLTSGFYAKTLGGLMTCYGAAIPFFKYTIAGDLVFNTLFFGAAYLIAQRFPSLMPSIK
jgi:hypothetical protein